MIEINIVSKTINSQTEAAQIDSTLQLITQQAKTFSRFQARFDKLIVRCVITFSLTKLSTTFQQRDCFKCFDAFNLKACTDFYYGSTESQNNIIYKTEN